MRAIGPALTIALALALSGASVRAEGERPLSGPAFGIGQRMALGMHADRWKPEEAHPALRGRGDQCRKWRRMADRLGETYAGYQLRTSVLRQVCGMLDLESGESIWDWPWGGLERGRIVPPRHVRSFGAWELRCGIAGKRRRCALVAVLAGPAARNADGDVTRPVAHFVIDMVGGREALLWRLFVPADRGTTVTELGPGERSQTSDTTPPAHRRGMVRYRLGEREHAEHFPACAAAGCLMEANVQRGGSVATRLWDGHGVDLSIEPAHGRRHELRLPATGFRAGFAELVRSRREERRGR